MTSPKTFAPPDRLGDFSLGKLTPEEMDAVEAYLEKHPDQVSSLEAAPDDILLTYLRGAAYDTLSGGADTVPPAALPVAQAAPRAVAYPPADQSQANATITFTSDIPAPLREHPRYRVIRLLGAGGMGAVYLAEHRLMHRMVALKLINAEFVANPRMIERFRREIDAAARLNHPNIVSAHDAEEVQGVHFLAMEYVEGESLQEYLIRQPALPVREACHYAHQVAQGLQHAWEKGMVHRDIKPHNLMLSFPTRPTGIGGLGGQIKILDFGLAALAAQQPGEGLTGSGVMMGTPDYMAPEQTQDAHGVDIRADIYALGCTFYQMLAGRVPFPGRSNIEKMIAHSNEEAPPLEKVRPDVPPGVVRIVKRMLTKSPQDRFQTPQEVADALTECLTQEASLPKPKSTSRLKIRTALAVGTLILLAIVGLWQAGVITLRNSQGDEFTIKTNDPAIEVLVKNGGKEVWIIDPTTQQRWRIDTEKFHLSDADRPQGLTIQLQGKEPFVMHRQGKQVASVTRGLPKDAKGQLEVGEVRRMLGHKGSVRAVAYSPCGKFALSGSGWPHPDGTLRLWDLTLGKEVWTQAADTGTVLSAEFSPDGRLAASGHSGLVRLWQVETGKKLLVLNHGADMYGLAFLPDNKRILTAGTDGWLKLWDVKTGKKLKEIKDREGWITRVALSPDGRRVVTGGTVDPGSSVGIVRLWDLDKGEAIRDFKGHKDSVSGLAYHPSSKLILTGGDDGTVRLWDIETGKEEKTRFVGHPGGVRSVAFSPEGRRILTGGGGGPSGGADKDHHVRLLDLKSGVEIQTFTGHADIIWGVAFSPDGRFALSCSGGKVINNQAAPGSDWSVRLWRLPDLPLEKNAEVRRFEGHGLAVISVAFSADGKHALSGEHSPSGPQLLVRLWEVATGKELRQLNGGFALNCVTFSPDAKQAFSGGEHAKLWNLETGKEIIRFEGQQQGTVYGKRANGWVSGAVFFRDGKKLLTSGYDKTLRLWDTVSGKELRCFNGHTEGVRAVALSPDERQAASAGFDGTVRLWNIETGKEEHCCREGLSDWVISVAYSPDGKYVLSGGFDRIARLWDAASGKEVRRFDNGSEVNTVAFCPDGKRLLTGSQDHMIRLWDMETGQVLHSFKGHTDRVWSVACSPDGRFALSGSADKTMRLWRLPDLPLEKNAEVRRFGDPAHHIIRLALSPNGSHVLTCGPDGTACYWEVASGKLVHLLPGASGQVYNVAISADGKQLLSCGEDSLIHVWNSATGKEIKQLQGHKSNVSGVSIAADGKLMASGSNHDGTVRLWDLEKGKENHSFATGNHSSQGVALSSDGRWLASWGGDSTIKVYDVKLRQEIHCLRGHSTMVRAGTFSADGKRFLSGSHAAGSNGNLCLWEVETGQLLRSIDDIPGGSHGVALSSDGRRALTGGWEGLNLWDLETGRKIAAYGHDPGDGINDVAFLPDGLHALSASGLGTIRLWKLPE
jgi:WD40 repeat protein/serine/threonine protein kinase